MQTVTRARHLRREMTLPEVLLWQALRKQTTGLKVRRQHPAGDCILDFYSASARLAIEVDGQSHASSEQAEHDDRRDRWLAARGVRVLRIPACEILADLPNVIEHILADARSTSPSTGFAGSPPRSGEELKEAS